MMKQVVRLLFKLAFVWEWVVNHLFRTFDLPLIRLFHLRQKTLVLYEYENCPFCRRVREVLCELDLDVEVYPCPRETLKSYGFMQDSRFRPEVSRLGGSLRFPFLVDHNTDTSMYESKDIEDYLWRTYGAKARKCLTQRLLPDSCNTILLMLASLIRPLNYMGMLRTPSKRPRRMLLLYSFEASPQCRLVREALSSLELPYKLINVPVGSGKRHAFRVRARGKSIPYLEDPNTDFRGASATATVEYLYRTYQAGYTVQEAMADYSHATERKQE